jgi:hypothetical protein
MGKRQGREGQDGKKDYKYTNIPITNNQYTNRKD